MSACPAIVPGGRRRAGLIVNNTANLSRIKVVSTCNQFYGNGVGTIIDGGFTANVNRADGNSINFEGHGDSYLRNTAATEFDHGGLVVLGADNISTSGGGGSNNTVNVQLWGVRTAGNTQSDLYAVGARSNSVPGVDPTRSQNNHVTLTIKGDAQGGGRWQPVPYFRNSEPNSPDEGNSVIVDD